MRSTMPDVPLSIPALFRHGEAVYADSVVTTLEEGGVRRARFGQVAARARRLASALRRLGVTAGDRVGTFAWNTQEHLEAYLAVPGLGAVLHTINIRLFPEEVAYLVEHAGDRVVLVDASLAPTLARSLPLDHVEHFVVIGEGDVSGLPRVVRYEELLAGGERALRLARGRRVRGRGHVLHERHDRAAQGRRLQPSLDLLALLVAVLRREPGAVRARSHPADRADVPRQRLGPALLRVDGRRGSNPAEPLRAGRRAGAPVRRRAAHRRGRGANGVPRPLASRRRAAPRSRQRARASVRRCRRLAGAHGRVCRALWRHALAGVGAHRDQPAGGAGDSAAGPRRRVREPLPRARPGASSAASSCASSTRASAS